MKTYKTSKDLFSAVQNGEIPADCYSPGGAARLLGISRQGIHERIHKSESLEAWGADGYILISYRSIKKAIKKKRGVPETQGELIGTEL